MDERMHGAWAWWRQRPAWVQTVGWALAWPLLAALWAGRDRPAGRAIAGVCVLLLLPLWIALLLPAGDGPSNEVAFAPGQTDPATGGRRGEDRSADGGRPATQGATREAADRGPASEPAAAGEATGPAAAAQQPPARVPAGVPAGAQAATVARHVDGDTVWVEVTEGGGPLPPAAVHKIRLLLIDTPETVDPSQGPECWGPEASQFAARQLPLGSTVYLVADEEDTDRYGRFLRYLWTADGTFFNEAAVAQGHARAVVYQPNDAYLEPLRAAEAAAKAADRGLWGPPCHRDAPPPAPPPPPPPAAPAPPPPPAPAGGSSGGDGCDPNYSACVPIASDVDCAGGGGNGPAYVQGPVQVLGSDVYGLDGDGDGTACN